MKAKYIHLLTIFLACFSFMTAYATVPPTVLSQNNTSIAPMLKKAMPAVVNIISQGELSLTNDPFLKRQIEQYKKYHKLPNDNKFASAGSGVIVDAKQGLIVTNAHVVIQAKTITVTLNDGRHFQAKKIGTDDSVDIALIQIPAKNLTALPLSDSNQVKVGDFAAAIGSPLGLSQSVTSGIVSGLHRSNLGIESFENFIQTDAPINMGNSGGALVNMHGQLIGINTALISASGGNIGIGFAIPSNMVNNIVEQLLKFGKVRRGLMGILVQTLTPDLAQALKIPNTKGALISQVVPYSPAQQAGLKVGDIITSINKTTIDSNSEVQNMVGLMRIGDTVNLTVLRQGKLLSFSIKTADPKTSEISGRLTNPYLFGVKMQNIAEWDPSHGYVTGIKVLAVNDYSPARTSGLKAGDIIVSANQKPVQSVNQLIKLANSSKDGLLLNIIQKMGAAFIVIK